MVRLDLRGHLMVMQAPWVSKVILAAAAVVDLELKAPWLSKAMLARAAVVAIHLCLALIALCLVETLAKAVGKGARRPNYFSVLDARRALEAALAASA
jgi:hypothetical protein